MHLLTSPLIEYCLSRKYDRELNLTVGNFLRKPPNLLRIFSSIFDGYSVLIAAALVQAHDHAHRARHCLCHCAQGLLNSHDHTIQFGMHSI